MNDRIRRVIKKSLEEWLQTGTDISSVVLKRKLYNANLKERKCELCGQGEEWCGKHMSLILDHINGIHNDNRLENLRIVCPNCNATLETHCKGAKGIGSHQKKVEYKELVKKNYKEAGLRQRKVERPELYVILREIEELGYRGTGRKYGVSDNAIRKWVK